MSDKYIMYDPAEFDKIEINHANDADEITRLRAENERLRELLLFAELMASEMGIDPREKCQRIYDKLHAKRAALEGVTEQSGAENGQIRSRF